MSGISKGFDDYISELVSESGRGIDFLGHLYQLAVDAVEAIFEQNGLDNCKIRLSIYLNGRLSKTRDVSSLEYIDVIERLYGKGCPLEGVQILTGKITKTNMAYVGALYYFHQEGSIGFGNIPKAELEKLVTLIAFEQGKGWDTLKPMLALIDHVKPGYKLVEGLPDLLADLDKRFTSDYDVALLQKCGGVERIRAVGANFDNICQTLFKNLPEAKLGQDNLPLIFQFMKDANDEQMATGAVSQSEVDERYSRVILAVMRAWLRVKGQAPDYYRTTVNELIPYLSKEEGSSVIPRLSKVISVPDIAQMFSHPREFIEPALFKVALKKYAGAEHRYDLVMTLGLDDLFTGHELNKLKGEKLESALGL